MHRIQPLLRNAALLARGRAALPVVRHPWHHSLAALPGFVLPAVPGSPARSFHTALPAFQQQQPQEARSWVHPDAVPKGEAMKKYARDLTAAAKAGKLDPVIGARHRFRVAVALYCVLQGTWHALLWRCRAGRDEEIKRTIQVLSRRTKVGVGCPRAHPAMCTHVCSAPQNNPVLIGEPGVRSATC